MLVSIRALSRTSVQYNTRRCMVMSCMFPVVDQAINMHNGLHIQLLVKQIVFTSLFGNESGFTADLQYSLTHCGSWCCFEYMKVQARTCPYFTEKRERSADLG